MNKKIQLIVLSFLLFSQLANAQLHYTKVSAGGEFSVALRSDGTLWSWGFDGNGQLGNGDVTLQQQNTPVQIGIDNDWTDIATGAFHCLAIKLDGTLWAWGFNENGELGDGDSIEEISPVQIGTDTDWKEIAAGQGHSLAIKTDGTLWAWGLNSNGEVGNGYENDVFIPVEISTDTSWNKISAGGAHTLALKKNGTLWAWGYGGFGELGDTASNQTDTIRQIGSETDWAEVSAGFEFSLGIKTNGTLWSWGFNGNGQLGLGDVLTRFQPVQIGAGTNWKAIEAGSGCGYAIQNDSTMFAWGYNGTGQLGLGSTDQQLSPMQVSGNWIAIAAAKGFFYNNSVYGLHALALEDEANVICAAGAGYVGQLGDGSNQNEEFTCDVADLTSGIKEILPSALLNLYPNPSSGMVTISGYDMQNNLRVVVSNTIGQHFEVKRSPDYSNNAISIDLSNLPKGLYFIELYSNNNRITVQKVVLD